MSVVKGQSVTDVVREEKSQGSVATHLRRGRIFVNRVTRNSLLKWLATKLF